MFESINIFAFIIFILIALIAYMQLTKHKIFDQLVSGFYESDQSFLQESGVDLFCIYIDNEVLNGYRSCYVLAKKDNDIIINEPTSIKLTQKTTDYNVDKPKCFAVKFLDITDEIIEIFPKNQTMKYYPLTGKIILMNRDEVTFVGYKNGINTEMKSVINENKKEYDDY